MKMRKRKKELKDSKLTRKYKKVTFNTVFIQYFSCLYLDQDPGQTVSSCVQTGC